MGRSEVSADYHTWLDTSILVALSMGHRPKQIAVDTHYSVHTIKNRIRWMRAQYKARNTPHLIALAIRKGVIT